MNSASLVSPSTVSADGENLILSFSAFGTVQIWNPARQEVLSEYTDFAVAINAI